MIGWVTASHQKGCCNFDKGIKEEDFGR